MCIIEIDEEYALLETKKFVDNFLNQLTEVFYDSFTDDVINLVQKLNSHAAHSLIFETDVQFDGSVAEIILTLFTMPQLEYQPSEDFRAYIVKQYREQIKETTITFD